MFSEQNENLKAENGEETQLSEMELKRANIIAQTFVEKVENTAPVRIGSTQDEKNSALKIRELYNKMLGLPSRMEPFTVRPLAGRFGIPILGAVYLFALVCYIIGVLVVHPVSYMFLAFAIVVTAVAGTMFLVQVIMDKNTFNFLFPRRTSYNVSTTLASKKETEFTLVLGSHYDSDMDRADFFMFMKDKNLPPWLSKLLRTLSFFSVPTLFVFAVVTICLPQRGAGDKAFLFLFPTIFCGLAIFYLITYFSYKKRNSSIGHEGLQGAGLALAVADYLRLHPDLVPDNCRIVVASFGCKECGAKGSEEFLRQHFGRDSLLINAAVLNFDKVGDNKNIVVQGDKQYKMMYDLKISNIAYNSLKETELNPVFAFNDQMVTDSTPFARHKIPTSTVQFKLGDNEIYNAFDDAFVGAVRCTVDTMNYMKERQEQYKGTVVDDISQIG